MKFRIVPGGVPSPLVWHNNSGIRTTMWSNTIQIRRFKLTPYPRFVWEDYRLGPWFGRFAGGVAYAKGEMFDREHREALEFIARETKRIRDNSWYMRLLRKL